jgi:hypothetical protein
MDILHNNKATETLKSAKKNSRQEKEETLTQKTEERKQHANN